MQPVPLEDRAVIALSGPEARTFLQGLITNDVEKLAPGTALYAALLTPQGKILFDFFILEGDGALLIDCVAEGAEALCARLLTYRLRAKVGIEPRDQLGVYAALDGLRAERGLNFTDPRLGELGLRIVAARAEMPRAPDGVGAAAYHAHRLAIGVPEGRDFGSDRIFALDADLDELHAVAFDKGCYVGQELTARMKHRGLARKRLLPVTAAGDLPCSGTPLSGAAGEIGEIVSTYGARGFALVRLDRWDEKSALNAGNIPVALARPKWLAPSIV